jgi:FAD/FMN-containing dehydrogenase
MSARRDRSRAALHPGATLPIATPARHYALVELATPREGAGCAPLSNRCSPRRWRRHPCSTRSSPRAAATAALWKLREEHSEAQKLAGASVKNDVSVPVSKVPELIRRATEICERLVPGIRCVPFGHLGDGNIHVNLVQPEGGDPPRFLARATTS